MAAEKNGEAGEETSDDVLYSFTVDGVMGKPRPRFARGRAYTPAKYKNWEKTIGEAYKRAGGKLIEGAVCVKIEVYRALPKSRPKRVDFEEDTFKPDADNIAKAVLDGLNGIAFKDDSQVTSLTVEKMGRIRGGDAFMDVLVWKL